MEEDTDSYILVTFFKIILIPVLFSAEFSWDYYIG